MLSNFSFLKLAQQIYFTLYPNPLFLGLYSLLLFPLLHRLPLDRRLTFALFYHLSLLILCRMLLTRVFCPLYIGCKLLFTILRVDHGLKRPSSNEIDGLSNAK